MSTDQAQAGMVTQQNHKTLLAGDDKEEEANVASTNQQHGRRTTSSHDLEAQPTRSSSSSSDDNRSSDHDSDGDDLSHISTRVSGSDMGAPIEETSSVVTIPDEFYDTQPLHRKRIIVAVMSYCSILAPLSSTAVLSAVPEVAETYKTTGSLVNVSNAIYMLVMGLSPVVWGPLSQVYGRRIVSVVTAILFCACSIGTALAPNFASFFVFRVLTAFEGTAFILVGATVVSDVYRPTERGTAMGWFASGTLVGPALGPCIGGIIVTYQSWRVIFWLQTALAGIAALATVFLIPETIYHKRIDDLHGVPTRRKMRLLAGLINPWRVLRLFAYPNLITTGLASSSLVWNMYGLLTPIRYVLNPRFHLDSPLQSGLIYLAPGGGYLLGTFFGGRWADYIVRRWIRKRNGVRIAEDRLRSTIFFMGVMMPACVLIYGWAVHQDVGGVALAATMLFLQGVAQLCCFPALNTYCLDVMSGRGAEVISSNYILRYSFACLASGTVLPAVESVGVGWFSTLSSLFLVFTTLATVATIRWGKDWRDKIDRRRRKEKGARIEKKKGKKRKGGKGDLEAGTGTGVDGCVVVDRHVDVDVDADVVQHSGVTEKAIGQAVLAAGTSPETTTEEERRTAKAEEAGELPDEKEKSVRKI